MTFQPNTSALHTRYQGNGGGRFSLAEVHQELQMLQRQLGMCVCVSQCHHVT